MASNPRDHLGRLPAELFYMVAENRSLWTRDLAALAATCRKFHTLTNPILYQKHLKKSGGQACKGYHLQMLYLNFCRPSLTAVISVLWAVENQRFTTIRRFLENGADINNDRMYRACVKRFKKQKKARYWSARLELDDRSIFTPLALAAALGLVSMVAFLLDHGADIEKPGKGLCVCAHGENMIELNFPPDQGHGGVDDVDSIMDDLNGFAWTPLHVALCRAQESTAILLLERGANPRKTCPCEAGPWNALHTATRGNHRKVIDYILNNRLVDINEKGHEGLTPLLLAFYENQYSLVDMYIDLGADINAVWDSKDGGWTILAMACLREEFSRASDLLRRGADPDFVLQEEEGGAEWTALGLLYGGMYGDWPRVSGYPSCYAYVTETASRRMLEQQIIQVKVDKALQQQRKENIV